MNDEKLKKWLLDQALMENTPFNGGPATGFGNIDPMDQIDPEELMKLLGGVGNSRIPGGM